MKISTNWLELAKTFRKVASEELLPRHGRLHHCEIHTHSDGSLFTEADLMTERRLVEAARSLYPSADISGEEEISENPDVFLKEGQTRDVLVFDPIDGTGAFKRGENTYGVMGAFIKRGVTDAGIIYTPGHALKTEAGWKAEDDLMLIAERGKGCWLVTKGNFGEAEKITFAGRPRSLTEAARVAFACRNQDAALEDVLGKGVEGYRPRNNSSYDYTKLLLGQMDATYYSEGYMAATGLGKCPPWDHAAGVLCTAEAGGYAALPYGRSRDGGEIYTPLICHDRLLVAASRDLFDSVMAHVEARLPHLMAPRQK